MLVLQVSKARALGSRKLKALGVVVVGTAIGKGHQEGMEELGRCGERNQGKDSK